MLKATMCMSFSQLLLATHTQLSLQLLASINNATNVYNYSPYKYVNGRPRLFRDLVTQIKWTLRPRFAGVSAISLRRNRLYHPYDF